MKRICGLLVLASASAVSSAVVWDFSAAMSGLQEVPPNSSPAFGSAAFRVDDVTWTITGLMTTQALTSQTTMAHIHEAPPGVNGPVRFDILANTTQTFTNGNVVTRVISGVLGGTQTEREALLAAMMAGNTYVNVHTTNFPAGEIRGQLCMAPVPEPGSMAAIGVGLSAMLLRRKRK
jgi:hypothetical protein